MGIPGPLAKAPGVDEMWAHRGEDGDHGSASADSGRPVHLAEGQTPPRGHGAARRSSEMRLELQLLACAAAWKVAPLRGRTERLRDGDSAFGVVGGSKTALKTPLRPARPWAEVSRGVGSLGTEASGRFHDKTSPRTRKRGRRTAPPFRHQRSTGASSRRRRPPGVARPRAAVRPGAAPGRVQ